MISNSPLVNVIGLVTAVMLNVIVEPSHASKVAWRKLPAPLSRLLITTGSVVQNDGEKSGAVDVKLLRAATSISPRTNTSGNAIRTNGYTQWEREFGGLIFIIIVGGNSLLGDELRTPSVCRVKLTSPLQIRQESSGGVPSQACIMHEVCSHLVALVTSIVTSSRHREIRNWATTNGDEFAILKGTRNKGTKVISFCAFFTSSENRYLNISGAGILLLLVDD